MCKYNALFPVLIILLFSGMGCQKKGEESDNRGPDPISEVSQPALEKITMNRNGEELKEEKEDIPAKEEGNSIEPFSGPLFLQQILPGSRILPEGDFCGPFVDFMSTDPDENRAGLTIRNFFHTYRAGIIDYRYLYEDMNTLFREELELFKPHSNEIVGYLAGSFQTSANRGSVRIRLFSERGSITGVLYLIYLDDEWYVEDWELPISLWPGEENTLPAEKTDLQKGGVSEPLQMKGV